MTVPLYLCTGITYDPIAAIDVRMDIGKWTKCELREIIAADKEILNEQRRVMENWKKGKKRYLNKLKALEVRVLAPSPIYIREVGEQERLHAWNRYLEANKLRLLGLA